MAVTHIDEELNFAALHERIAAAVPGRECIVWRDRRLTWAEVTDRTRRLAAVLRHAALGVHPHEGPPGSTSPHDHVALYLHNGNEYLEGMLGAAKARCAAVNVNYRYVAEELLHVLADSQARAVVYHDTFADTLAEVLPTLPDLTVLLQVDDGSGCSLLPGARRYEDALAEAVPTAPSGLSPDDLYILYTGGTTGLPKGVLWRQADFLAACLGITRSTERLVATAATSNLRVLAAPPFMHGAAHWNALSAWSAGGTVVIQDDPSRLDPDDILTTVERERVNSLLIVGDAFARPLADALATGRHDVSGLSHLLTGGAVLSASVKDELLRLAPQLRIVDVLGSSETGRQGVHTSDAARGASSGTFERSATSVVLSADLGRILEPGDPELGWLAQAGRVPLGYLGDPDKTARTFPTSGGVRYAVAGDRARVLEDGSIELHGRDSVTINTGGEKVFAEEVEQALKHHPSVFDTVVVGRPSERWGQEVVAVVQLRADGSNPTDDELRAAAAPHIARYKLPKHVVRVEKVERSPSGKPDYGWASRTVVEQGG
ncbi:MAG: acyl-CoA synthetase [Acidimicrobiales bacterium]|nr:acyl-CoA synthetase [Acidimicrobiales bacterium]